MGREFLYNVILAFALLVGAQHPCQAAHLPDPALTPGVIDPACTVDTLKTNDTRLRRNTSDALKATVYEEYDIHLIGTVPVTHRNDEVAQKKVFDGYCNGPQGCEVDHRVPLEVCGADVEENLWIQPYDGPDNAHCKDQLENRTKREVVSGRISLAEGQARFLAPDWTTEYLKIFGRECQAP